ncbi:MAG: M23 family metallopeptidase [Bacteroidales bacterium]|nr:M23 family metallopeptidase [Bacteroidales bacterium]
MNFKDWWYRLKDGAIADVIKRKHRFVVMDTDTFKEKFSFQLSGINLFVTLGITIIVLILLTTILIAFTPLREWIPGYTNTAAVEQTYSNAKKIDSLQVQLENQEWMVATLQAVLRGEELGETQQIDSSATLQQVAAVYRHSKEDSLLRLEVEREDNRYQVKSNVPAAGSVGTVADASPAITHLFFTPLKGNILTPYSREHQGVDIAGETGHAVCAAYSGTVIFSGFTAEGGHTLTIQHPGNVVTIYRNCSSLLMRQGDMVRAGEPVAYVGNGGHRELGPYLHFEIWVNGASVNPEEYISF